MKGTFLGQRLQEQVAEMLRHPRKGWRMAGVFFLAQLEAVFDHDAGAVNTTPFLVPAVVPMTFVNVYRRAYARMRVELAEVDATGGEG